MIRQLFRSRLIVCGGYDGVTGRAAISQARADMIAFGRGFIANPDLVERLRLGVEWNPVDPSTFYDGGERGYVDYPRFRDLSGNK